MKRIVYFILICAGLSSFINAQPYKKADMYKGTLLMKQKQMFERNDTLYISIDIRFSGSVVPSALSLKLLPVLKDKKHSFDLPYVIINGRQRAAYFRRERELMPYEARLREPLYASITQQGKDKPQTVSYNVRIPFKPWMSTASLVLLQIQQDCCSERLISYELLSKKINFSRFAADRSKTRLPDYATLVDYISPEVEAVKARSQTVTAYIDYPVGKAQVLDTYSRNREELEKIRKCLSPLLKKDLYTIEKVIIVACASPEGEYETNRKLARLRALGFKDYLCRRYKLPDDNRMEVSFISEDWVGLEELVAQTAVPEKNKVLDILRNTSRPEVRKVKLEEVGGGASYRYMLKKLYPLLRRMELQIDYVVRALKDSEAAQLIYTYPQNLSLNEMFRVARRFKPGSDEYRDVFEIAARYYPDNVVANINAAASSLALGDLTTSRKYLEKTGKDPRASNNWGVWYLLNGDLAKAEACFKRAMRVNPSQAEFNLQLVSEIKAEKGM